MTRIYVGTEDGAWRLDDTGGRFEAVRSALEGRRVQALAVAGGDLLAAVRHDGVYRIENGRADRTLEADPWSLAASVGAVFAGLEPAGVAGSTDSGRTWRELASFRDVPGAKDWWFPAPPHVAHTRSIVIDRSEGGTVFAGIEVGGVLVSEDGGERWQERFAGLYEDVHTLVQSPSEPEILYAATGRGFYRSFDRSRSWTCAMDGMDRTYTVSLAALADHPDVLVMSAAKSPPGLEAAFYRSEDGGFSWERLGAAHGLPERLDRVAQLAASDDACFAATVEGKLYRSDERADRWELIAEGLPPATAVTVS